MRRLYFILFPLILLTFRPGADLPAQEKTASARMFYKNYEFEKAVSIYKELISKGISSEIPDSASLLAAKELLMQCENGAVMMQYITDPEVISRLKTDKKDFYLYISSLEDGGWKEIPNPFVPLREAHTFYNAIYLPEKSQVTYFSAPDETGSWNLYSSVRINDTLWSAPALLSEALTTERDEIMPFLSKDGKTLYFASNGLAGMGGFDLFKSTVDPESGEWSDPENLGFPLSSIGNDILYMDSEEGSLSFLVSDRESANGEEVTLYLLKGIVNPVKRALRREESAAEMALLIPDNQEKENAGASAAEKSLSSENESYSALIYELQHLKDEYSKKIRKLEESRSLYDKATEADKEFLMEIVMENEKEALSIRRRRDSAAAAVTLMETSFLSKGIIPQVEEKVAKEEDSGRTDSGEYAFKKKRMGKMPLTVIEKKEPTFDYTFKIEKTGQFAVENTLPEGLIYQIQFAVLSAPASIKEIRGMSPVFVTRLHSGKYLHTVGLFKTHAEALSNLNKVRKNGFSQAFIVAFNNGKSIKVQSARTMEKKRTAAERETLLRIELHGYGEMLPESIMETIRQNCTKDISKTTTPEGVQIFTVGPFNKREEAERVLKKLEENGTTGAAIKKLN